MNETPNQSGAAGTVWFGDRPVAEPEKAHLVRAVFDSVADRYDVMNDLMSGGVHRLWKAAFVDKLSPRGAMSVLDVAGGTGDIAQRILERAPEARVTVADINERMLRVGRDRATDRGLWTAFRYVTADAEALPVQDRAVDAYTIAFGLRNVTHIDRALAEARRVLKPGGRFLCLEFSRVVVPGLDLLYQNWSRLIPVIGQRVAGDRDSYQYLVESIRRFPPQQELAERMASVGFERVSVRNLSGGIAAIHEGWRL
jgi:demethylmenaquinone methyltransferase/2-methoxy-6-polyprenyl-1,4-benzoquinol methylase